MKLKYLGTAAAEGIPAVFCRCPICLEAKKRGGKDIRTRSQSMVNDDLLIDFPCDTYSHMLTNRLDLSRVKYIIVTHAHEDHFYPAEFGMYGSYYAHDRAVCELDVYCDARVAEMYDIVTREIHVPDEIKNSIRFHVVNSGDQFDLGERYKVTAFSANHCVGEDEKPLIYLVREGEKSLLYAHDTGFLEDSGFESLKAGIDKPLDMLSLDATIGKNHCWGGHLGFYEAFEFVDRLKSLGIVSDKTRIVFNHFSHNGALLHDEAVALAGERGISVSFDGMEVEF